MTKVKICGLKSRHDIEIVNKMIPNYVGFILAPSKRQISLEQAKTLKGLLNFKIKVVGVFVNEPIESILIYEKRKIIDCIQLHGNEDIVYLKALKKATQLPIIKAFRMKFAHSLKESLSHEQYELMQSDIVDYILVDTYHEGQYGGSGKCFNWEVLTEMTRPYFLAGGVGSENIQEALRYKPYAIDMSSKTETNGCKDEDKIRTLMEQIKKLDQII